MENLPYQNQFKNWKDALVWLFNQDARYSYKINGSGSTILEISSTYNKDTRIVLYIGDNAIYERDVELGSLEITNPNTPGLNRYWQDVGTFFEDSYKDPSHPSWKCGLPFNEENLQSLFEDLKGGYKGIEKHYFQGQTLIAIHLKIEAGCLGGMKAIDTWQIFWRPKGFVNRLKWFFSSAEKRAQAFLTDAKWSHVEELDLSTIFKGVLVSRNAGSLRVD